MENNKLASLEERVTYLDGIVKRLSLFIGGMFLYGVLMTAMLILFITDGQVLL